MRSIPLDGGLRCVDLFRRTDGGFGVEEYRRDPENGRGWYPIGHHANHRFSSAAAAL
ncbi:MAG: hypothetical protein AAF899_03855 [Pseudomonadota bacterium]